MTVLARHELEMPAGTATITTSRPADDAPWTVEVAAPGLDVDGWTFTTTAARSAHVMHLAAVDVTRRAIAEREAHQEAQS